MNARSWSLVVAAALVAGCGGSAPAPTGSAGGSGSVSTAPAGVTPAVTGLATTGASSAATVAPATAIPSPSPAPIGISEVECLTGQTVRFHVRITSGTGIASYELWSTWGGGGNSTVISPTPLPTHIDEIVEFTHEIVDPDPGRAHQFGLAVMLDGATEPILTYAFEPDGRCPGH